MIYQFQNTKTKEIIDVSMSMKEYTPYKGENGNENCWKRIYDTPQISMNNTKVNPFNNKQFVEKTGKMKGTMGDMQDLSSELSAKRAEKLGKEDPVKREHFNKYERKVGKKHVRDNKKVIENSRVKIEMD